MDYVKLSIVEDFTLKRDFKVKFVTQIRKKMASMAQRSLSVG